LADLAELSRLAVAISSDLTRAGIEHALTGSLVLVVLGRPRQTQDIDVVVAVSSIRLPAVFEIARRHGFVGEDRDLITQIRERSYAALRSGPITLDVIVPVLPYHSTIVKRAKRVEIGGVAVPLVTAEDLFVMKVLWHRAKDEADLLVLNALPDRLDGAYVRATLAGLLPTDDPRHAEVERLLSRS
jgi:predicted nucleotidyltransferase